MGWNLLDGWWMMEGRGRGENWNEGTEEFYTVREAVINASMCRVCSYLLCSISSENMVGGVCALVWFSRKVVTTG